MRFANYLSCLTMGVALAMPAMAMAQDSAAAVMAAREAQARLERTRAARLPWTMRTGGGACDEHVGRYCLRYDGGDEDFVPPPEHPAVVEARQALLRALTEAALRAPADWWVAGQRVHALLEAGHDTAALTVALGCAALRWWCLALEGLVWHHRGETIAAEGAFNEALGAMPPDERHAWRRVAWLLDDREARSLGQGDSASQETLAARLWWLADPLWSVPGNDRRTEHFARLVRVRLAGVSRSVERGRWGDDRAELTIRFGWPVGWERYPRSGIGEPDGLVAHHAPHGRDFVPPLHAAVNPARASDSAFAIARRRPRTEHAPAYARFDARLDVQLAAIPAGDRELVLMAAAMDGDSLRADSAEVALAAQAGPGAPLHLTSAVVPAADARAMLALPRGDVIVSAEAVTREAEPRAARWRRAMPLAARDTGHLRLSDPVFVRHFPMPPRDAREALARMLRPSEVRRADSLGVYWEAEGFDPAGSEVEVELELRPERAGALRRLASRMGLVSPRPATRFAWRDAAPPDGRQRRAVGLGVGVLPGGDYRLRLTLRQGGAVVWREAVVTLGR